ncbi:hypothetical protein OL239_13440 [Arthrobacter sp. ATA002]|uniref:hypothetical protein n=1 Tax=Arthrobacter sp. ATA002 TaxID=2991715 RepID=UPI0022A7F413|nr:hypothetical protein [Arthrobacter sp. ATA002]WAP53462.1 hypothetical protein OL239_13440 [Arthrobacter sp. ATA002]
MQFTVSGFAVSLNVPEPEASARFLTEYFGYGIDMQDDGGFFSLRHPNGGSNIIFLRTGLSTFKRRRRPAGSGKVCCWCWS